MEQNKQKRALVAGGAGFIGSHLCDRLISEGYHVICLDNLYTGRIENISHHLNNPHFEFVNQDVITPFEAQNLSVIFNLACPASPKQYQKDAIYTTKISVLGTINLLELATANKCPVLQASTSEVYGDPLVHPQPETYYGNVNPVGIRSCYDEGKRCEGSLCMDYFRHYRTKVKIVRIFNTYGPRMSEEDGRVVSNFVTQALKGEPLTIYGDGSQTRSFMYVSDLIEAFMRMIGTEDDFTGPVNLGNPEELTIKQFASMVVEQTSAKTLFVNQNLPQNDPTRRKPDTAIANKKLSWSPYVNAVEGIQKVIDYFRMELALSQYEYVNSDKDDNKSIKSKIVC